MEKGRIQTIKLVDLADYQEGSIVTRTIIDKKTGTVTFFAFDQGQGLSEHTAPFDALAYLLDGEAEVVISGQPFRLKGSEMVVMPANDQQPCGSKLQTIPATGHYPPNFSIPR